MTKAAQQRACGIAAIILAKASVEGAVEASISSLGKNELSATLKAFDKLILELKDRAGMDT